MQNTCGPKKSRGVSGSSSQVRFNRFLGLKPGSASSPPQAVTRKVELHPASTPDGSGRTLKLSVKGELNWDATYVAPTIEELTGSWLVSPDTVSQHWDVPFELELQQDGTQLSGVICAGPLASGNGGGLNGDGGLDADGGSQVGFRSDAGVDGGAGFGCSGTPLTGYVAYGEGHLRWNLDDGTLAQLHVAKQDGALVATYERRPGALQTGTWVSR